MISKLKNLFRKDDPMRFEPIPANAVGPLSKSQIHDWNKNGFLILRKFFSPETIDLVNETVDGLWTESREKESAITMDIYCGPNVQRTKLHNAPLDAKKHPYKMNDLYLESEVICDVALEDRLTAILKELLRSNPIIVNSLNLEWGSQQRLHIDSHFTTPPKGTHLVASWIALEDITEESGPLLYYPRSHRIPPYLYSNGALGIVPGEFEQFQAYMKNELEKRSIEEVSYTAEKGDVLIWHGQLYHGGSKIRDLSKTRKSLVTHYFRKDETDCVAVPHRNGYYMKRDHQPVPERAAAK